MPAVARQIYRGDVKESAITAPRYVHIPSLLEGKLDFMDNVKQQFDIKTFNSDKVPAATLAAAKVEIEFTDAYRPTPAFNLDRFRDGKTITSETGQLRWTESDTKHDGFFTMDTPGTKAVVGFAAGKRFELGDVVLEPACEYAAIYVTAAEPDGTIDTSDMLLVFAIARARNTGQEVSGDGTRLLAKGAGPVRMEPVRARITLQREGRAHLVLLDHDGLRTDRVRPVENGIIEIDGTADRTPFYLVELD
jgi:hypothetical protein